MLDLALPPYLEDLLQRTLHHVLRRVQVTAEQLGEVHELGRPRRDFRLALLGSAHTI